MNNFHLFLVERVFILINNSYLLFLINLKKTMSTSLKINHLAVWACIVLSFILGFIWYGPLLGETWMALVGLDPAVVEANPPGAGVWITNLVSSVIPMYVLAWLYTQLDVRSGMRGAGLGFLIVFAFNFLSVMVGNMFAQAPYELTWITGGFDLVLIAISGFILGAWTKNAE